MKRGFFHNLCIYLFSQVPGKPLNKSSYNTEKARLMKNADLQKVAQSHAARLRLLQHANSCTGAYLYKMKQVKAAKGKNTLSGIPTNVLA